MADGRHTSGAAGADGTDPFGPLDPDLTIFALANGLDLERERDGHPCRALAWYREGLERTICIEPAEGTGLLVWVGARRGGRSAPPREVRRPLAGPAPVSELEEDLRPLLARALDAANALGEADLA